MGTLWLATPLEQGDHDVWLYGWHGDARLPLRGPDGRQIVIRISLD
jgi:hypothetical protein